MQSKASRLILSATILSGAASSLVGKALYQQRAIGRHGLQKHRFKKPWFQTLLVFLGMAACLPFALLFRYFFPSKDAATNGNNVDTEDADANQEPLLPSVRSVISLSSISTATSEWWQRYDAVLWPTLFDVTATALLSTGLLFTTVSMYQMMRGAEIVFTALLSSIFLHRVFNKKNLYGLGLVTIGLVVVGVAGVLPFDSSQDSSTPATSKNTLFGVILIIVAELIQASQVVAEEFLLNDTGEAPLDPLELCGYEGLFGSTLLIGIILPVLQWSHIGSEGQGLREDTLDSLAMLKHSLPLLYLVCSYLVCMLFYNLTGLLVTDTSGALARTIAETFRTLFVWVIDLVLYKSAHIPGAKTIGEPWTSASWLQAVGFGILVVGTAIYAQGEEEHRKKMEAGLSARARMQWARVRAAVMTIAALQKAAKEGQLTEEECRLPVRPGKIYGTRGIATGLKAVNTLGRGHLRRRLRKREREQREVVTEGEEQPLLGP